MASIREKRPGYWEVRVFAGYDDQGRPVQASRTVRGGKRDAERLAAHLSARPAPQSGRLTVGELLHEHLEHSSSAWSPTTRHDYALRAARIAADPIGSKHVSRVTVAEVDRWHLRLRRAGVGEAQIRNLHTLLRAAFGSAVRLELVANNPVAAASPRRAKRAPREVMPAEAVAAVLAVAHEVHRQAPLAFRLAAVAGARRAELAALRWDRLDGSTLVIDQTITVDRSVPVDDPGRLVVSATKTGDRRRLTLEEVTVALLDVARAAATGPWVFGEGDQPPNPDGIGWWWTRARKLAGIDTRWRLHDLRHWSATHAIAGGHDLRSVAARLGHADPTTTMRTYAHAVAARDAAIAQTLAEALDGEPDS